jgi:hypothetical protein
MSRVRFWFPKSVETVVRCTPEGIEQFLQRMIDLAQSRNEQVAWGKIKAGKEVSIGVSLRRGDLFLVIGGARHGGTEFNGDRAAEGDHLRHAAAVVLYDKLTGTFGVRPDQEVRASMKGQ